MIIEHRDNLGAFRRAVRDWARATAPAEKSHLWFEALGSDFVDYQRWWMGERQKVGLGTPHWPVEFGGAGLGLAHQVIIADEFARARTPGNETFIIGINHVPATLIPFGSDHQKKTYMPTVGNGTIWCQGFSEPAAGSDLAALRTRAVRDGDHYIVNGQKIWSSFAMYAGYCLLLARTDPDARKHEGISYFILDMSAPGVEVRPIRKSTGTSNFAEIFLTDVRIPVADRIGAENAGWQIAQATLSSERGVISFEMAEREMVHLEHHYATSLASGAEWLDDDELRRDFLRRFAELQALRRQIRTLLQTEPDLGTFSMAPSLIKLARSVGTSVYHDHRVRHAGLAAQLIAPGEGRGSPMYDYLDSFGSMISGGTNDVMRNLIAERGLGMPKG